MKQYEVEVSCVQYGSFIVDANSPEEAEDIAGDMSEEDILANIDWGHRVELMVEGASEYQ